MDFGLTGKLYGYGLGNAFQKSRTTEKSDRLCFQDTISAKTAEAGIETIDAYREYLESKYGSVMIKSVGKDQRSIDSLGAGTFGTGNVVIAPNILEEMANDPEKAAYYEGKIQNYFASVPGYQAELSAMGHEIHSCGIVIHPDGTVTHYISGDLKPEVRAKVEARIKAEREAKEERRQKYLESSQEAADKRRELMEIQYQKKYLRCLDL